MDKLSAIIAKEYRLTPREHEVLKALVEGKDSDKIAKSLFVSPNTVKSHIQKIYNKLDVHSRKDLLRLVEGRRKLFSPP